MDELGNEELLGREQVEGKWRRGELHSNEVELLAYYVGCANVEQTYTVRTGEKKPFQGAVLTNRVLI